MKRMPQQMSISWALSILRLTASLLFLSMFTSPIQAAQAKSSDDDPDIVWVGVEAVTNDTELEDFLKNLTGIHAGDVMKYSDPRLHNACANIRKFFPRSFVNCRGILMEHGTSLYAVEFSLIPKQETTQALICHKTEEYPQDFETLVDLIDVESRKAISHEKSEFHEFINADGYLDSTQIGEHEAIRKVHEQLLGQDAKLSAAVKDCDAKRRETAFRLLNYLGKPELGVRLAAGSIDDPDENVRNNAMRLLSSFATYVNADVGRNISKLACNNLENANLLDRNKGLSLIWEIVRGNIVSVRDIEAQCILRIRHFSETSQSDQVGAFARLIMKKIPNTIAQ